MNEQDDDLSRALGVYAASTSGDALDSTGLRRRVLNDVAVPTRRAPRKLSFVLALAATFVASAALAASQPAVRDALYRGVQTLFGASPPAARSASPRPSRALPLVESAVGAAEPVGSALPNDPTPISPSDLPALPRAASAAATHSAPPLAPGPPTAPPTAPLASSTAAFDAQVESYRQAHRLHFDGAPPAKTLAAWDQYLLAYPNGSFAPDARFNRALSLLRLGRRDDARDALRPFAEAPVGSYRQQEAASLLLSLDSAGR